jgi:hypothetical protein
MCLFISVQLSGNGFLGLLLLGLWKGKFFILRFMGEVGVVIMIIMVLVVVVDDVNFIIQSPF